MPAFESWLPCIVAAVSPLPRTSLAEWGALTVSRQDELMNDPMTPFYQYLI